MSVYPSYSVAIRTVGTSGDMFVRLIKSLTVQTFEPDAIYVYIAAGAVMPHPVANEKYIVCERGMVAQRALPFEEVKSQYILFCDDDMYLPQDAVQKMFDGLLDNHYDAISACIFPNHKLNAKQRFIHFFLYGEKPRKHLRWAYYIRRNSFYSYAINPDRIMDTQSFPGGCFLVNKQSWLAIDFQDERWMDSFRYALGDDQLASYKLYSYGFRLGIHFNTDIQHLDARAGRISNPRLADRNQLVTRIIMWYRSIYEPDYQVNRYLACLDVISLSSRLIWQWFVSLLLAVLGKESWPGNITEALRISKESILSEQFRYLPKWETHKTR